MRFALYASASSAVTAAVVLYAYATRVQFYPAVIYLVTSKFCIVALGNMALVLGVLAGKFTKRVFLGRLRDSEMELVWDNAGYAFTETCLALTIFRDEMSLNVVVLFSALLFTKVFHWLCDARVEHIEQTQDTSRLAHFRILSLMMTLVFVDVIFTLISIHVISTNGPSVQLLFGFEYALLCILVFTTIVRYSLSVVDNYFVQGRWYNKSLYELYLRLIMDIFKLLVYSVFFAIVFAYYGVPIHLLRQLYISFKTVNKRVSHFILFRKVTANLNERFQNATEEELEATDKICIICREEMVAGQELGAPKRLLPCGHIFHFYCLRNWFERQLKCPTCRADILPVQPEDTGRQRRMDNALRRIRQVEQAQQGRNVPQQDPDPTDPSVPVSEEERLALERRKQEAIQHHREAIIRLARPLQGSLGRNSPIPPLASAAERERRREAVVAISEHTAAIMELTGRPPNFGQQANSTTAAVAPNETPANEVTESNSAEENKGEERRQSASASVAPTDYEKLRKLRLAALARVDGNTRNQTQDSQQTDSATQDDAKTPSTPEPVDVTAQPLPQQTQTSASQFPAQGALPNFSVPNLTTTGNVGGSFGAGLQSFPPNLQTLPSVTQHIQSQIEVLQLQLHVYTAQIAAANATREAALATLRARGHISSTDESSGIGASASASQTGASARVSGSSGAPRVGLGGVVGSGSIGLAHLGSGTMGQRSNESGIRRRPNAPADESK